VHTSSELQELLQLGEVTKRKAVTQMNERSSRAHALLFLFLEQKVDVNRRKKITVKSTLCMADLGGCEQLKKSGARGERLKEAIHINMGLLALKQCITRLNKHSRMAVIPYNDSRLTQLLRSALGGDAKTTVVVTCSMESSNVMETIHALRFGEKCAVVQNVGGNKVSTIADQIAELDNEIAKTRTEIVRKEQWTNAPAENKESFALEGFIPIKSALVGAEAEGERLAKLLEWRAQLLGNNNVLERLKVRKARPFKPAEWKE
jgi:kinesin family protein 5